MGKKVNGLTIDFEPKSAIFLIKNRSGETIGSKSNMQAAIKFAKKDRTYVAYSPSIGGSIKSVCKNDNKNKSNNMSKNKIKNLKGKLMKK